MKRFIAVVAILAALTAGGNRASAEIDCAAILQAQSGAIVTVSFTLKMKMNMMGRSGEAQEIRTDIKGVLIDRTGLVLVSATQLQGPAGPMKQMLSAMGSQMEAVPSEFSVVLADGSEHEAVLKARDSEMDIALIRTKAPLPDDARVTALAFAGDAPAVTIGEELVLVSAFTKELNYGPQFLLTRVNAVIEKPRMLYALMNLSDISTGFMAAPAFNAEGRLVGLVTYRPSDDGGMASMDMSMMMNPTAIMNMVRPFLLPSAEVAKAIEKAKKAPEKKPGKKKKTSQ